MPVESSALYRERAVPATWLGTTADRGGGIGATMVAPLFAMNFSHTS